MATTRSAKVDWKGSLFEGEGTVDLVSSGLLTGAGVSWPARTEESNGKTSPEELIAAAHAACFAMAFSKQLNDREAAPDALRVTATSPPVTGWLARMYAAMRLRLCCDPPS